MDDDELKRLKYEMISDVVRTRESSTVMLLSVFISASFVMMGIIAIFTSENIPFSNFVAWMGLLLILSSIVYRLLTNNFNNRCYNDLMELEEDLGYSSDGQEVKKTLGAYNWLYAERDSHVPHKWTGQVINILLAALFSQWIVWLLNIMEYWTLLIAAFSFAIIFLFEKRGLTDNEPEPSDLESS